MGSEWEGCPGPLLASAWVCCVSGDRRRSGGLPVARLMRGDIGATFGRCLFGVGRSLQAYCAARGFLAGKSAPERCDPVGTSPVQAVCALWIGGQLCPSVRFWLHMAKRGTDQDDQKHGFLR